jgi:putative hydrolase of the HAD superfamily
MEESMLKAITFDLWQTLIMETPEGSRWVRAERIRRIADVLRAEQITIDPEAISRAYATEGEQLEELWKTHRDIGSRTQVEMLLDILQVGKHAPYPDLLLAGLVDACILPILSAMPVPLDNAPSILEALEARGLRLAVICNTGRTPGNILRIILERLGMAKLLSVQTFSDELGWRKPHPEIFTRTLAALGVEPAEALHVGDSLASDIAGASAIGMRAVHLCHQKGANPSPGTGETIVSLTELLPLIDR